MDEQPQQIHGVQWTIFIAFLLFLAGFAWSIYGPMKEWATFDVVYTPKGLSDLVWAGFCGLAAMLLALGVDIKQFVGRALGR